MFVSLDRDVQGVPHPLGGVVVRYELLGDFDRLGRHIKWLRVESEVYEQFFGHARHAAEIGIRTRLAARYAGAQTIRSAATTT